MNQDEIYELNEREPSEADLLDLTDIEIANLDTAPLRAWAEVAGVEDHHFYKTIATLPLDSVMINTTGALPALEKFLTVIKMAYTSSQPEAIKRYENIDVRIIESDDHLRSRLTYQRDRALKQRDG